MDLGTKSNHKSLLKEGSDTEKDPNVREPSGLDLHNFSHIPSRIKTVLSDCQKIYVIDPKKSSKRFAAAAYRSSAREV